MHVNFLPDEMEVKPDLEQVPPLFIAAMASYGAKEKSKMLTTSTERNLMK
jgi:hypothetical protein